MIGVVIGGGTSVRMRALMLVMPLSDQQHVTDDDPARADVQGRTVKWWIPPTEAKRASPGQSAAEAAEIGKGPKRPLVVDRTEVLLDGHRAARRSLGAQALGQRLSGLLVRRAHEHVGP